MILHCKKQFSIFIVLIMLIIIANGCGSSSKPPEEEGPKGPKIVKIIDILSKPDTYKNQTVLVEGKIVIQCSSGCWFKLKDDTGVVYVDLAPSNLVIPQKRGAAARVYGEVVNKKGDIYLIGKKVEF